ncbi:MAG: alkaline phosphatase family protein, partial [Acidobacteriota bacterium]
MKADTARSSPPPPVSSPFRRRTIGLIALGAVAAALLGISVRHVPEGTLVVKDAPLFETAPVLLTPGWHLAPPGIFRLSRYDADSNELVFGDGKPLQFETPEGAAVIATINLRFRLDPDQVLALHEQCNGDLTGWLEEQARSVTATLIRSPEFVPLTRERLPLLEDSGRGLLEDALKAVGVSITGLRFERLGYEGAPLVASGPRATSSRKVLWLAVDSFDWDLIRPLVEQGRMPNMKRLLAEGVWGNLQSVPPLLSPVIWTSVATAKRPEKHGIVDFVARNPETGAIVPVTSTLRTTRAFWNILSDAGVSVGVIAWWASFPAEKVHGFMVTDRVAYQLFKDTIQDLPEDDPLKTHPANLYSNISSLIRPPVDVGNEELSRFVDLERHSSSFSEDDHSRLNEFRAVLAASHTYAHIGMKLFTEQPTDVRVIYFEGPDTASHLFMPFMPPQSDHVPAEKVEWFGEVVPEFYEYQDEWIGRFIDEFADDETTIVLSSDHGFKVGDERPATDSRISKGRAADWHAREGMILFSGKDTRKGERILGASILDVVPTLLALYGLPVGGDMDGKVLTAAISEEFLVQHPVQEIASYDPYGEDRTAQFAQFTQDDQELLMRLQSLGYIQQSMPTASINQGTIYMQSGEYAEAISAFEAALEQTDKEPVRLNLARAYRLSGDRESARLHLDTLLKTGWNRAAVLTELSALHRDEKDWASAERFLDEALKTDPEHAEAHLHFARLYEQR